MKKRISVFLSFLLVSLVAFSLFSCFPKSERITVDTLVKRLDETTVERLGIKTWAECDRIEKPEGHIYTFSSGYDFRIAVYDGYAEVSREYGGGGYFTVPGAAIEGIRAYVAEIEAESERFANRDLLSSIDIISKNEQQSAVVIVGDSSKTVTVSGAALAELLGSDGLTRCTMPEGTLSRMAYVDADGEYNLEIYYNGYLRVVSSDTANEDYDRHSTFYELSAEFLGSLSNLLNAE